MAAPSTKVKATFITSFGLEFTIAFHVPAGIVDPNDAGVQAIIAAVAALTSGFPVRVVLSVSAPHAVTATSSQIYVNEDKGEFIFVDDGAQAHTFKLPAPKTSIVGTDKETIDGTGAVGTFLAAVAANALGPSGEAIEAPLGGMRRASRKSLKK
jgi:hypothetical protein